MLSEISIQNLGVIPEATLEFSPGFTVLTGETGAGKTMVVTSLRLLSGGRADAGRVRTGADKALVEGRIATDELEAGEVKALDGLVEELGGERDENNEYLLARQVSAKGRSKAWVGGRAASAAVLGDVAAQVIAIHGQNDQLRLQSSDEQRRALDRLDAKAISPILAKYHEQRATWRALAKELEEKTSKRRELAMRADQLTFAINEIDEVSPEAGEDVELAAQIRRMQDLDGLRDAAVIALSSINGPGAVADSAAGGAMDEDGAADLLGRAADELSSTEDEELQEYSKQLVALTSELADIASGLGSFLAGLPEEAESLDSLMQRQADIKALTRKYAPDIDGVLAWRDKAQRKLATLDVSGEALEELAKKVEAAQKALATTATKLTAARVKAARRLEKSVTTELQGLAMPHTQLVVAVEKAKDFGPDGRDDVAFLLKAHKEAEPRPLATSASGGELSRIMLALEVVLAEGQSGRTMVFDEVDAGVGGRAAVEIGKRLARLAGRNQVIVVTHLPQVAAFADTHLVVSKNVGSASVSSGVETLDGEGRIEELARMMAGLDGTESGRAHAQDLLERAQEVKASFK